MMDWKAFADELPEKDRLILYGNHRHLDVMLYFPEHRHMQQDAKLAYKNITHWCYIDPPLVVPWESKWNEDK